MVKKEKKKNLWITKKNNEIVYGNGMFLHVDLTCLSKDGKEDIYCYSIAQGKYGKLGKPNFGRRISFRVDTRNLDNELAIDKLIEFLKKTKKDYSSM